MPCPGCHLRPLPRGGRAGKEGGDRQVPGAGSTSVWVGEGTFIPGAPSSRDLTVWGSSWDLGTPLRWPLGLDSPLSRGALGLRALLGALCLLAPLQGSVTRTLSWTWNLTQPRRVRRMFVSTACLCGDLVSARGPEPAPPSAAAQVSGAALASAQQSGLALPGQTPPPGGPSPPPARPAGQSAGPRMLQTPASVSRPQGSWTGLANCQHPGRARSWHTRPRGTGWTKGPCPLGLPLPPRPHASEGCGLIPPHTHILNPSLSWLWGRDLGSQEEKGAPGSLQS